MADALTLPGIDAPVVAPQGAAAKRTFLANQAIANGRHPLGSPLANNGQTCGSCEHSFEAGSYRKRFKKCELRATHSEATDIRLKWPACISWEKRK